MDKSQCLKYCFSSSFCQLSSSWSLLLCGWAVGVDWVCVGGSASTTGSLLRIFSTAGGGSTTGSGAGSATGTATGSGVGGFGGAILEMTKWIIELPFASAFKFKSDNFWLFSKSFPEWINLCVSTIGLSSCFSKIKFFSSSIFRSSLLKNSQFLYNLWLENMSHMYDSIPGTYGISFRTRSLFWPGIRTIISFISSFKCYFLIPKNPGHVVISKWKCNDWPNRRAEKDDSSRRTQK